MMMTRRRFIWLAVILALLLLYFPINRLASGGWALALPLDESIPLFPPALLPYLLGSILFVAFPVWAAFRAEKTEFEAYLVSFLTVTLISYLVYLLLPTYVLRPEISSEDYLARAVALLYENDYPYNAAPSGHTFYTLLSFLYIRRWRPKLQAVWLIAAVLIIASTLLTKQHYLLDVVTGLALGLAAYLAGRYAQRRRVISGENTGRPGWFGRGADC